MIDVDRPRLLVIDDDTIHRMVISRIAERARYVVASAASCADATALVRQRSFECITLDLSLGRDRGIDVMHALAAVNCRAPLVIISSADTAIRQENLSYAGQAGLNIRCELPKPLDLVRLREVLEDIASDAPTAAIGARG